MCAEPPTDLVLMRGVKLGLHLVLAELILVHEHPHGGGGARALLLLVLLQPRPEGERAAAVQREGDGHAVVSGRHQGALAQPGEGQQRQQVRAQLHHHHVLGSAVKRSIGSTTSCTITEKAPTRTFSW